ncbi:MAG: class I SAM-dependent methyltransferase [Cyclobacteriaceae bacterium]
MSPAQLNPLLGNMDIYLLDQVLKGRFSQPMRILDVGCGEGRNLVYFIRQGMEVWGIDRDLAALRLLRMYGKSLHPDFDPEKIIEDDAQDISLPPGSFDAIISSAVLHFAENEAQFSRMFSELVRLLRPGGVLFIRTASRMGIEPLLQPLNVPGRFLLPDGSERFLPDPGFFADLLQLHQMQLLEPARHVVVEGARSMGVWVLGKNAGYEH